MAWRIAPKPISVGAPIGKREPREKSESHLDFIRSLPCCITNTTPVDAAHIRYASPLDGKRETGKSEKPHDRWTVPLSRELHVEQHNGNEREFWESYGIDPLRLATALYFAGRDYSKAMAVLRATWATLRSPFPKRGELMRASLHTEDQD